MVDKKITIEELNSIVELYPWYAGARVILCQRLAQIGALTQDQLSQSAMHLCSRRSLAQLVEKKDNKDLSDSDAKKLVESYIQENEEKPKKVYVVGGDYFSQEEYNSARNTDDSIFSRFATQARDEGYRDNVENGTGDFCTETLAKIYLQQEYIEQAIDIYSKLSLRYPEKSIYFAALIDEIKQKDNNK